MSSVVLLLDTLAKGGLRGGAMVIELNDSLKENKEHGNMQAITSLQTQSTEETSLASQLNTSHTLVNK